MPEPTGQRSRIVSRFTQRVLPHLVSLESAPSRTGAQRAADSSSNHVSYLDPVYVVSALERMVVGLARESANVPLGGRILRSWRVIPVDQTGNRPRTEDISFTPARWRCGDYEGHPLATGQIARSRGLA